MEQDRVALCIEYNGSCFNGWQAQKSPNVTTVQETLETALSEVADHPVNVICAGRTDSGVHATGQVVHFDFPNSRSEDAWIRGGNSNLPESISIRWAKIVSSEFHARFSARSRLYRYVIYNDPIKPALLSGLVTSHFKTLDAGAMHEAGQLLLGENDFSSFRGAACQSSTPMRNIYKISVQRQDNLVTMNIEANAFLLHMVRNIAGVLMEIGEENKPVEWAGEILALRDRASGGITAPPDGLYLVRVDYPALYALPEASSGPVFFTS